MDQDLKIIIRQPKKSELEKVYRLGCSTKEFTVSDEVRYYRRQEIEEFTGNNKDDIFLVAVHKSQIVGSLFAKIISRRWCMLDTVCVKKNYQRRKIGSQLLERLYAILIERNIHYVQGIVGCDNIKARDSFKRMGFEEGRKFIWFEKFLEHQ
jgi:ribosomal protein S18 acetylase RimI-like enzyme